MTSDNTVNIIYIAMLGAWGLGVLLYCLTAYFRTLPVAVIHHHHHHHHHRHRHDQSPRPVREPIPLCQAGTPAIPHFAEFSNESEPEEIVMANTRLREEGEEREVAIALGTATTTTLPPSRSASYHPHSPTLSEISPPVATTTGQHPQPSVSTVQAPIYQRYDGETPYPVLSQLGSPQNYLNPPQNYPQNPGWTTDERHIVSSMDSRPATTQELSQAAPTTVDPASELPADSTMKNPPSQPPSPFADTASATDVASFYSTQPEATPWYTTSSGRAIPDDCSEQTRQPSVESDDGSYYINRYVGGRVTHIAVILWEASFLDIFNHFIRELPLTTTWLLGAGRTYTYHITNRLDAQEQLSDKAGRFTVQLWNQLHPDDPREVEAKAQEPHPMPDTPPQRRPVQYAPPPGPPPRTRHAPRPVQYAPPPGPPPRPQQPRGYGPPGQYARESRLFAGGGRGPPAGGAAAAQNGWPLPRHPSPPGPPAQPGPWPLLDGHTMPYDSLKPTILREVQPFKGDSGDIRRFFSQCEMHFSLHNNYL
ncbi:hypothetical protein EDD85DRAFT_955714 [Armillaria nabsnona]|nr:hypothetical protein EDD85DRAFT_955714 [Armillaria nabsnona]